MAGSGKHLINYNRKTFYNTGPSICIVSERRVRYLMGDNLKAVWTECSTFRLGSFAQNKHACVA
jgi:hypothetical protein